ncbi:MAG: hypothetical protein FJY85_15905, partial [Deltaproteobacteria bacterium]|nr:hypothetical protein [Deltaproteobacteria bacterium]
MERTRQFTAQDRVLARKTRRMVLKEELWSATRSHCLECVGTSDAVKSCGGNTLMDGTACALYDLRLGKGAGLQNDEGRLLPRFSKGRLFKAIRL